ncbi:hypothetical protein HOR67_gp41 [Ralstonia phage RS-PI-1]|uniref:Uncharacterized protein n=1 Tax=Ralstonia phage RS-PI-1 TaxID=1958965 RepID=A0A1S6L1G1_9CAUD|nr:hypothetical protein HOR67_gp41 [Ralstonia phage RS-PI-1]AQT27803.1 hypothetical protein [Ralstonia phage RS-PI-1]
MFNIQQARRRILNAIDTVHRIDNARGNPAFRDSPMGRRLAERQQEQGEQVRHTLDVLIAAHEERDALRNELAETKAALQRLVAVTPSCVLAAGLNRGTEGVREVKYEGHGKNTGGLQQHSIGEEYPFITYKRGDKWRILDSRTGHTHTSAFVHSSSAHKIARDWSESVKAGSDIAIQASGFFGIYKERA